MIEDCPICYDKIINEAKLVCGHHVHMNCLQKQFKPECPLCRCKLNIVVFGCNPTEPIVPVLNIYDLEESDDEPMEIVTRKDNYLYREEDPDYDEENPYGDEYDYENEISFGEED